MTLDHNGGFEICLICWWEDDGQNDDDANEVRGGPNGRYSLTAARHNFNNHGDMYDPGEGILAVKQPSSARRELLAYLRILQFTPDHADETKLSSQMNSVNRSLRRTN